MWSSGVVTLTLDKVIPQLPIAVECSIPEVFDMSLTISKYEGSRLVLKCCWWAKILTFVGFNMRRIIEPVLNIFAPEQGAMDLNLDVVEVRDLYRLIDTIGDVLEGDY